MTDKTKDSDVSDDKSKDDSSDGIGDKKDVVDYATHKKLLDQRKSDQNKLRELETKLADFDKKQKDLEESEAKSKGDWKTLVEARDAKIAELSKLNQDLSGELTGVKGQITDAKKLSAFEKKLGGKLKQEEYYEFVDLDKIAVDPETGKIDDASLAAYTNDFSTKFKDLISFGKGKLPDEAGKRAGQLTYEEWLKLPVAEKRARMKDVK